MSDILLIFLSLSLSGSILALTVFAINRLFRNKLSQTWQYYIWLIVILRFLLPVTTPVSILGEFARQIQNIGSHPVMSGAAQEFDFEIDYAVPQVQQVPQAPFIPSNVEAETPAYTQSELYLPDEVHETVAFWREILNNIWMLWLAAALVLFARKVVGYRSFVRFVNVGNKKITDAHILDIYFEELAAAKVKRVLPFYMNNQVASPMLVGIFHPALVIPALGATDDELRNILRHELTHNKRLDSLYKWAVQIALSLHWFNPLVYLINKQINKSCELSCDEAVIMHLDDHGRIVYGDALMASLQAQGNYRDFVVSISMSENGNFIKERLDTIMGYKKKTRLMNFAAFLISALLLFGFVFTGAYTGTYAATQSNNFSGINPAASPSQPTSVLSGTEATTSPGQAASYVIECASEEIIVKQEGTEFKVEQDPQSQHNYVIRDNTNIPYGDRHYKYNKWDVIFERKNRQDTTAVYSTVITVTIPKNIDGQSLLLITYSGDIHAESLTNVNLTVESKSGNIYIANSDADYLSAETISGNIELVNITSKTDIKTRSIEGAILVKCGDSNSQYAIRIDTDQKADITVNGKRYDGGNYLIGDGGTQTITLKGWNNKCTVSNIRISESQTISNASDYSLYQPFGITVSTDTTGKNALYYNGQRVRILVDQRQDKSSNLFFSDKEGTVDLRVARDGQNRLTGIEKLDDDTAKEFLDDLDFSTTANPAHTDFSAAANAAYPYRLTLSEIPSELRGWIEQSDLSKGVFAVRFNERYFVYCNSVAGEYGWQPSIGNTSTLKLFDLGEGRKGDGYALLSLPLCDKLTVSYYGATVTVTKETVQAISGAIVDNSTTAGNQSVFNKSTVHVIKNGKVTVPFSIANISAGTEGYGNEHYGYVCLGQIPDISNAKRVIYTINADSGTGLFAAMSVDDKSITNQFEWYNFCVRPDNTIDVTFEDAEGRIGKDLNHSGNYFLYVGTTKTALTNITGNVTVEYCDDSQNIRNIDLFVENCNVTVRYSVNDQFSYDYDQLKQKITQTIEGSTIKINVERVVDGTTMSLTDMVVIYLPTQTYDNFFVEGYKAGIGLPEINANLHLVNNGGSMRISVPGDFSKTIDFKNIDGSGSLLIDANAKDYTLTATSQSSSVGVTPNLPSFTPNRAWEYKNGNGNAKINLDIQGSSFSIKKK